MTAVVLVLLAYAALFVVGVRHGQAQEALMREAGIPENPAVHPPSLESMREAPEFWFDYLREKIRAVHLANAPVFMRRGAGFGEHGFEPRYVFFLVDVHGEAHELARSKDEAAIGADARWLADGLGLELEYRS